ncbi:MAG: 50S ribosomal protein L44e [Candidatus Geothermarchaeota archaeon]
MKAPSEIRTYCPRCNTHTIHSVSLYKKGRESKLRLGARKHEEKKKGYGGQKWPELRRKAKTTKKAVLVLTCKQCKHKLLKDGIRIRKIEIAAK